MIAVYIASGLAALALLWIIFDVVVALRQKPIPDLPSEFLDPSGLSLVYYYLTEPDKAPGGLKIDEKYINDSLAPSIKYIENSYDCADFRLQLLFRLYKDCAQILPESTKEIIKKTFLGFKYWMDEPGEDSMCYWSENHQLLFAVSEYLAGQEWPDEVFSNNGMTGRQHQEKAIKRINIWMEQRFKYGFAEWLSNNYYAENIAPMSNYIEYSKDRDSVERMKIIFDLLWFDVASHAVNNTFAAVSSRMYGDNKSSHIYGNRIRAAMDAIWSTADISAMVTGKSALEQEIIDGADDVATTVKLVGVDAQMMQNFTAMYKKGFYKVPEAVYNAALDTESAVIKCSSGLDVKEFKSENLIGQNDNQIMAQLCHEAFTNPEVIENTYKYLNRNKMFKNIFVNPFRYFNIRLLRFLRIPAFISRYLGLMTNGIALNRGNIYSYRTKDYALTTAVALDVDDCGAQAHIWTANIAPDLCVYTTHPARDDEGREKHGASPGYWVGNGRQPMSVQDKNINITIYKMPKRKRLLEFHITNITHAFMPKEKFDELEIDGNYAFGRRGNVLIALIGRYPMKYRPYDAYAASLLIQHDRLVEKIPEINLNKEFDLVSEGEGYHFYITELSDTAAESFEEFKKRISENAVRIKDGTVVYYSRGKEYAVGYDKIFKIDGIEQKLQYKRFDSKYSVTERNPAEITITAGGKTLYLNYDKIERKEF